MERVKKSAYVFIPLIISLILLIIPFFWFKPGEMDLGGDSSRLYFYDPLTYLSKATLYIISPSSYGAEYLAYSNIPFILFLFILKSIVISPTIFISMFYGISLSGAFLFTYLSIKELLNTKNSWMASIIGGLVYVFSPPTLDGWKHVLITYNHIFLSPLIFYLILRYFKTSNIRYILGIVLITFLFSPNFSVAAAPSLFSFYPVSILFLIIYTKLILKRGVVIKHIILGLVLFIGIQAFHLFPTISSIFSSGNDINSTIFTEKGKFDRGLSYFLAIVPQIKTSLNLFVLPQMKSLNLFANVFITFPFIIIIGFVFNKKKVTLLTAIFFLVILFFATGNITNIWLALYKSLFSVPGFSMFRNFHSQWVYTYLFFYALLFSQAFFIIENKLQRAYVYILTIFFITILTVNAWAVINGDIPSEVLWQSHKVKSVFKIDPDFEKALSYVRSLSVDAKILTLPLTDPGYQIVGGKDGGAYMGPSTISYLAGKKDFAGYDELLGYKELILQLIKDKEYEKLKKILGFLNIKYIFYDADPLVYNKFPSFPYEQVRTAFPKDQKGYRQFISKLNVKEIKNINNKFFVFELSNTYFIPHITIVEKSVSFNKPITDIQTPFLLYTANNNIALFNYSGNPIDSKRKYGVAISSQIKFDEDLIDITQNNSYTYLTSSINASSFGYPFVSWDMTSPLYPFIIYREKKELESLKAADQMQIDRTLFLTEKRIAELENWGKNAKIIGNVGSIEDLDNLWQEPSPVKAILLQKYNYWEVNLLRFYRTISNLINQIEKQNTSDLKVKGNKYRVSRFLHRDRDTLYRIIQSSDNITDASKLYLLELSARMISSLDDRLQFDIPTPDTLDYNMDILEKGKYDIYVDKNFVQDYSREGLRAIINGREFSLGEFSEENGWFKIPYIKTDKQNQSNFKILIPKQTNLIANTLWKSFDKLDQGSDFVSLIINDDLEATGLMKRADNWKSDTYYFLSFDYKTNGKRFNIKIFDKSHGKNPKKSTLLEEELYAREWKSYKSLILSSSDAGSGYIQFIKSEGNTLFNTSESQENETKIDIKNFSIIKIPSPKILVKKVNIAHQQKQIPSLTYTRVNPTKYVVKIQDAKYPYTLVLVDQFNPNWKLVDPTQDTNIIRSFFAIILGKIGRTGMSLLGIQQTQEIKGIVRYFDGNVKQNVTDNDVFIDKKTFDTWGKTGIAEYKHFPANGYANAWNIEPKDMQGKEKYTLVIEITSQKMIYGGIFISVITFFISLFILTRTFFKNRL